MSTIVWITTNFAAFHRWENAPEDVSFLRDWHRHIFHVKVEMDVSHDDRCIEFFQLKRKVDAFLRSEYEEKKFSYSCEMIAKAILKQFKANAVEVNEDGENGARVEVTRYSGLVRLHCFVGTEAEGPHRGQRVLFVPGCIEPRMVEAAIGKVRSIDRVYLGAGNVRCFRKDTLESIKTFWAGPIDVEVESLSRIDPVALCDSRITKISLDDADIGNTHYQKIMDDKEIIWLGADGSRYVTDVDDPLYGLDEEVK